jgi:hypothetical protein
MWQKYNRPPRKASRPVLSSLLLLLSYIWLISCDSTPHSAPAAVGPAHTPTVVEVVGHYALQMAQRTRLPTAASRQYASTSLPEMSSDGASFTLALATCAVKVHLNEQQQPERVFIYANRSTQASPDSQRAAMDLPQPERLIRLGELRRVFGDGKIGPARLHEQEVLNRYPVLFRYLHSPDDREVSITATLFTPEYADSAMVHSVSLSSYR